MKSVLLIFMFSGLVSASNPTTWYKGKYQLILSADQGEDETFVVISKEQGEYYGASPQSEGKKEKLKILSADEIDSFFPRTPAASEVQCIGSGGIIICHTDRNFTVPGNAPIIKKGYFGLGRDFGFFPVLKVR